MVAVSHESRVAHSKSHPPRDCSLCIIRHLLAPQQPDWAKLPQCVHLGDECRPQLGTCVSTFFADGITFFYARRRRNYIDFATAQSKRLVSVSGNQVTLRADSTTVLNSTGPGRDSFDLLSTKQYTTHVAMHVPLLALSGPSHGIV